MLGEFKMLEIQILYKQGYSLKKINRETGHSINTIRKYIKAPHTPVYKRNVLKVSKLENYKKYLQLRIEQAKPHWIPAIVLLQEIKRQGYQGEISLLRQYLHPLKPVLKTRSFIRFETEPGEQMQVDFAHFKHGHRIFYAFIALLGYSRMAFVKFVENQAIETVISCHEAAFDYFGGVPKKCLYDNMKTIIIKRHAFGEGKHKLNSTFYDFAKHYGFQPCLCKPYNPQTKGKVERIISYLRYSFYHPFMAGKGETSLDEFNFAVETWLNEVANRRLHATTQAIPFERWHDEKKHLLAIPQHYTRHYGEPKVMNVIAPMMAQNAFSLQHPLSTYEALLNLGGNSNEFTK